MATFTEGENTAAPKSLPDDKQIQEDMQESDLRFWVKKIDEATISSFYVYDQVAGAITKSSQTEIDLRLIKQARELGPRRFGRKPESMQRFNEVMDHFLGASGRTLYFQMADLLNNNEGARKRVAEAITFRLAQNADLIFNSPSCDLPTHVDWSSGKPVNYSVYQFPIHQKDYKDPDWQFALGTFGAMWEPVIPKFGVPVGVLCKSQVGDDWMDEGTMARTRSRAPQDCFRVAVPQPTQARVWGTKIWRWHSETGRGTAKLHQVAYGLVQSGVLKNFWLIGQPCTVEIKTGQPV